MEEIKAVLQRRQTEMMQSGTSSQMVCYKSKEEAQLLGGTVYTFRLKYSGSESSKDVQIQVVRPNGHPYFIASSWSSCYVYVKQIAYGQTFNGLD